MEHNQNSDMDLRKIVRSVLEHWWWFLIGLGVFLSLGLY